MKPRAKTLLEWSSFLMICALTGILLAAGQPLWEKLLEEMNQLLLRLQFAATDPYAFI